MERSLELMVGLLGILKAGGVYVPLDPAYPPARLAFMVADAQVPVMLTQDGCWKGWRKKRRCHYVCLDSRPRQYLRQESDRTRQQCVTGQPGLCCLYLWLDRHAQGCSHDAPPPL